MRSGCQAGLTPSEYALPMLDPQTGALRRVTVDAIHRGDEAVAVLGHRLDEAWAGGVVAELAAEGAHALGQRLVGYRHAAPHFVEEAVLGDELPLLANQQGESVEVAAVELDRVAVALQLAVVRVERESLKDEASGHFSAKPHALLMPFTGRAGRPAGTQSCMEIREWQQKVRQ